MNYLQGPVMCHETRACHKYFHARATFLILPGSVTLRTITTGEKRPPGLATFRESRLFKQYGCLPGCGATLAKHLSTSGVEKSQFCEKQSGSECGGGVG